MANSGIPSSRAVPMFSNKEDRQRLESSNYWKKLQALSKVAHQANYKCAALYANRLHLKILSIFALYLACVPEGPYRDRLLPKYKMLETSLEIESDPKDKAVFNDADARFAELAILREEDFNLLPTDVQNGDPNRDILKNFRRLLPNRCLPFSIKLATISEYFGQHETTMRIEYYYGCSCAMELACRTLDAMDVFDRHRDQYVAMHGDNTFILKAIEAKEIHTIIVIVDLVESMCDDLIDLLKL